MPTHPIALHFPDEAALRIALTSGLVPAQVQAAAAGLIRLHDGALQLVPSVTVPDAAAKSLRAAGVKLEAAIDAGAPISCWAQALETTWLGEPDQIPGMLLCAVPHGESVLDLAAEMLRLGCDRQELRFTETEAWLRVVQPPYYSVARILDGASGIRAYVPSPAGQDRVWTELGFAHPLAHLLKPDSPRELLLIGRDRSWVRLGNEGWTDIYQLLDLEVAGAAVAHPAATHTQRLRVPLRLARAPRPVSPSFWVLRSDAVGEVDRLVQNLPDDAVDRLLFAAAGDVIVLRARSGLDAPPELVLDAESYVPLAGFQNLFLPGDTVVEPPLRRDRLRELLTPDPDRVFWLAPLADHGFRVESVAQSAFIPLSDWVDYVVHSNAAALEPWVRSAVFEFERFESIGGEWDSTPPPIDEPVSEAPGTRRRAKRETETSDAPPTRRARSPRPSPSTAPSQIPLTGVSPSGDEEDLAQLERDFLASTAPADDNSRLDEWLEMAHLHTRLEHGRESGLCWTRAIWEVPPAEAGPWLREWVEAEARVLGTTLSALPASLLARSSPSRDETRAFAAYVAWAAQDKDVAASVDAHAAHAWLDQHDQGLDVRSLWLSRTALARHVGGDRLGLTRAHDRVLARLQRGLSLERDVPAFLRFSSRAANDLAGAGPLVAGLESLLKKYETTKRKRHAAEAPVELTNAYVTFVFACGMARLGQGDRARSLRLQATHALEKKDKVHQFLARAYGTRIEQALEGLPPETPLPGALEAELGGFDKDSRYAIDQLRRFSTVLEPHESLDPITAYRRNDGDARGAEFAGLRGLGDAQRLGAEIDRLTQLATAATGEDRRRLFSGILDFLPALPESRGLGVLQLLSRGLGPFEPRARAAVAEKLLLMAGYFAAAEIGRPLAEELVSVVPKLPADGVGELAGLMGRCLRSLRRLGLRDTAATLLHALLGRVEGEGATALASRVSLAGGLASLGRMELAQPAFDAALSAIRREVKETREVVGRCALVRAYCTAASQTNPGFALARIPPVAERLVDITEFMTAKYFCPPVVNFMESLVLGLASEDLELGEAGRRWLDEDEYLVRRRVHRG